VTASALLDSLAHALLDEERARAMVRDARRRQAGLLQQLRRLGQPATRVAHALGAARGEALSVADRQRVARRLRKRAARETARLADLPSTHGHLTPPAPPSDRALPPTSKERDMQKLVKRTTVEEYVESDDLYEGDEDEDITEPDTDEVEVPKTNGPARRSR
jgi:hypothetical protein